MDTFLSIMPAPGAQTTVVPALITLLVKYATRIIIFLMPRADRVQKDVLVVII